MRGSKRSRRVVGLLLACGLGAAAVALATSGSPGSLDPSFTSLPGRVITPFGSGAERANALAVQSDGKLVAAGFSSNGFNNDFALASYNTNGSLDTSFDGDGKVLTAIGSFADFGYQVAIQSDGSIVVAGGTDTDNNANYDFALARYLP